MTNVRKEFQPNRTGEHDFCHVSGLSAKIAELKAETHLLQTISDRHRETKLPALTAERMFYRDAPGEVMHYDNGNALRPCSCGYLPDKDRKVHTGEQIYCPVCNAKHEAVQIREATKADEDEREYLDARREYLEAGGLKSISIKQFLN
jgi:hypothetical protein